MIKTLLLNKVASYDDDNGQLIEPLKVNFLFGLNGSGKTTISRFIATPTDEKYSSCQITWDGSPIKCAVYNRDFVEGNFSESVPGIFTLGEGPIGTKELIKQLTDEIAELEKTRDTKTKEIDGTDTSIGYKKQLKNHEESYAVKFWEIKQKLDREDSPLLKAISGVLGSKDKFKDRLISESEQNKSELFDKTLLATQSSELFGASVDKATAITQPSFTEMLSFESDEILSTVVVGKDNVAISELIQKLGNSAWFSQGKQYLDVSDGVCPFCQQLLPDDFSKQVEEYFDDTYKRNMGKITSLASKYGTAAERLIATIQTLVDSKNSFLDIKALEKELATLKTTIEINKKKLSEKTTSPNSIVTLETLQQISENVEAIIETANQSIREHNARIDNIKEEKEKLTSKVWKYIVTQLAVDIATYSTRKDEIKSYISEAQTALDNARKTIFSKTTELRTAEEMLTSIIPTANGINAMLENYGFNSFKLKVDDESKTYQFVRANGEPAFESLSEGEKNFVTFLYFIHTLRGNTDESGHEYDKILIIDDPVSSLDNDVLFLVSTLIRDLFKDIYSGKGSIKQLFVLSHNLYFFKEVSYKAGLVKKETGYWMITKTGNTSKIASYKENPVSSTYEMLWDEVIQANENPSECNTLTLANAMRRIVEYYFRFLGGKDISQFHLQFPDGERQILKSLISWMHAGSHSAFDDFSATTAIYSAENHLKVFRDLFDKSNQIEHYNMMMKIKTEEETNG
ncbi:AAA family ATPase [uncultured Akkermansia sp.]|uniref:AAA family ATPase n=1 Tax=uncultured Akkermansia sp. TaxID=512294 RepID=UPI0026056E30|nr:AAA family ATPase [uncultured Akkermansia sp.]